MNEILRALGTGLRAVFGVNKADNPADQAQAQLLGELAASMQSQKRKANEDSDDDTQHTIVRPPSKRQRRESRTHGDSVAQQTKELVEAREQEDLPSRKAKANESIAAAVSSPTTSGDILKPVERSRDRHLRIVPIDDNGVSRKALVLDKTLVALFEALIEAERDGVSHNERAEHNRDVLKDFQRYAHDEIGQLQRGEWVFARPPYDEVRMEQIKIAQRYLREKIHAVAIEREEIKARLEHVQANTRVRQFELLCPLEDVLMKEELLADEKDLSETNSSFERYFAIPDPSERYQAPEIVEVRRGSFHRVESAPDGMTPVQSARGNMSTVTPYGQEKQRRDTETYRGPQRLPVIDHAQAALHDVHLRRRERDEAQARFDQRYRGTGADHFLRCKARNKAPYYETELDFDLHQLQDNIASTRALITAEKRLAEAKAAARALNVDITTASQTSDFNDPDGDADPEAKLSAVHRAAVGVCTSKIGDWMVTLPATVTHDGPVTEMRPEQPELDDWVAVPVGECDSASMIDDGQRKARIEREKQAAEKKRQAAVKDWSEKYPRRKPEAFDRWHVNRRGGTA